jgi:signal transduction histidine kinase
VIDQGRGIPEQAKARIFERFQQIAASDWKEKGGSGLGLPISKAIVEQHNGSIGVDSEEGKGSQFWFRLPMKLPAILADPTAQASALLQSSAGSASEV